MLEERKLALLSTPSKTLLARILDGRIEILASFDSQWPGFPAAGFGPMGRLAWIGGKEGLQLVDLPAGGNPVVRPGAVLENQEGRLYHFHV